MTDTERLLAIDNYEEYKRQRLTFMNLKPDKEVIEHLNKIFPKMYKTEEELYKTLPPRCPGQ